MKKDLGMRQIKERLRKCKVSLVDMVIIENTIERMMETAVVDAFEGAAIKAKAKLAQ